MKKLKELKSTYMNLVKKCSSTWKSIELGLTPEQRREVVLKYESVENPDLIGYEIAKSDEPASPRASASMQDDGASSFSLKNSSMQLFNLNKPPSFKSNVSGGSQFSRIFQVTKNDPLLDMLRLG